MAQLVPIKWINGKAKIIDQTLLPTKLVYEEISTTKAMYAAILALKVRGAPLIGISAAYGICLAAKSFPDTGSTAAFLKLIDKEAAYLASSRPTAVNLFWALDRMKACAHRAAQQNTPKKIKALLLKEAHAILEEDRIMCRKIGEFGYALLKGCKNIETHCNAGGLATSGFGTALAPIYIGKEKGAHFHVYVDETRPLLQGARITAFELREAGVPATVICDNMAAFVMSNRSVDAVIVGADRIAANGDTANKIGTFNLAIVAKAHGIPFYVAAPSSTFDLTIKSGKEIPIEERNALEIVNGFGRQTVPSRVPVFNPAFDVTPHEYITAIITERGVIHSPKEKTVRAMMK